MSSNYTQYLGAKRCCDLKVQGPQGPQGAQGFQGATGAQGATGVLGSVGAISASSTANGASITGTTLNLAPADGTNGGVVTNTTQTFAGVKTFNSPPVMSGASITSNTIPALSIVNNSLTPLQSKLSYVFHTGVATSVASNAQVAISWTGATSVGDTYTVTGGVDVTIPVTGLYCIEYSGGWGTASPFVPNIPGTATATFLPALLIQISNIFGSNINTGSTGYNGSLTTQFYTSCSHIMYLTAGNTIRVSVYSAAATTQTITSVYQQIFQLL